jgi:glycosyltransferase involved in cell wall biosynthesis
MRVLQVGPYSPPHGGIQAHIVALRKYLQQQGVICDVVDINRFRRTDGHGVFGPRNALHLLWLLLTLPADIVHLHIGGNLTKRLLILCLICGWLPNRKSILTFHSGGYPSSPDGKRARPDTLRGWTMRRLDHVIGVNQEIVDVFKRYGLPEAHLSLIQPHSLPPGPPTVTIPEPLRSFQAAHTPILISVGLLEPEYDLPLQIDVLGLIREKFPATGLIMIGSGSLEAELRERINSKPYDRNVLLCGDVDRDVTHRVIADCDVFLRTTLFDGDSISVREALHFGVPVIASDCAARPEGVNLVPKNDLNSLVAAIETCLSQTRSRVAQHESRDENLESVLNVYRQLLGN